MVFDEVEDCLVMPALQQSSFKLQVDVCEECGEVHTLCMCAVTVFAAAGCRVFGGTCMCM